MVTPPELISLNDKRAFWRGVILLSLPVAAQMLMQSLLGMADVIMVGGLGASAIAAVGLAAKIHFLLLVLMSGLATGCSILVAQYTGAKDFPSCQRSLAVTLLVGTLVMLPFVFAFGFGANTWVQWINPDPVVVNLAAQYLIITAPALLFTQWIVIYEASLRALGSTTMPLVAGVCAALVNIAGNYALIGGNWGMPALGVAGAAWATLGSRALQLIIVVGWIYAKKHGFALNIAQLKMGLDKTQIQRYLAFSLPLVANYAIWAVGNSTYHLVTGYAGTDALAVMGVIVPIESAFFALFVGLANASAVLIGRELGAGNNEVAWYLHKFFDRITFALLILFCSSLWFARPLMLKIFDQLDAASTELLLNTLGVFCLLVSVKVINMMRIIGVLRAGGDNRFTLITDTIVMWCFGVPIYIAAVFLTKLSFIYLYALMFLEDALKFIPVIRRIASRKWMNNLTRH
ncbi:MATE family efflux transporter [Cellvibrio sp. KY-GH-1]|uniref:MATE family efflux transporter n=1 Tax=Cellvibrio sp. KY-GH-1 TaxID=2303332 RepID=UPI001245CA6E|nr:MATE family efflux transporter [Cellvibrio sp. KY-GH-1]QEY17264.1 MATE family efflux transporter [Cellvibrio sp. KY-GH-1]